MGHAIDNTKVNRFNQGFELNSCLAGPGVSKQMAAFGFSSHRSAASLPVSIGRSKPTIRIPDSGSVPGVEIQGMEQQSFHHVTT